MILQYVYTFVTPKNIERLGINLTSEYCIQADIIKEDPVTKKIEFKLSAIPLPAEKQLENFYGDTVSSLRLLVGENGSGKTSLLNEIRKNLFAKRGSQHAGFFITDKYIVCRNPSFSFDTSELEKVIGSRTLVRNLDILDKTRPDFQQRSTFTELKAMALRLEFVPEFIDCVSLHYCSNVLNLSEISTDGYHLYGNASGLEVDYMYYHDYTIANRIVQDQGSYIQGLNADSLPDGIIAHKIRESGRIVGFLLDPVYSRYLPDADRFSDYVVELDFDDNIEDFFLNNLVFDQEQRIPIVDDLYGMESSQRGVPKEFEFNLFKTLYYSILSIVYGEEQRTKTPAKAKEAIIKDYLDSMRKKNPGFSDFRSYVSSSKLITKYINNPLVFIEKYELFFRTFYGKIEILNDGMLMSLNESNFWTEYSSFIESDAVRGHLNAKRYLISPLKASLSDLSDGERNLIRFFSGLRETKHKLIADQSKSIQHLIFLIDEPDMGIHPEWQRTFLSSFLDFINGVFKGYSCQIILTAHSPFFASDIMAQDITYLKRIGGKVVCEENRAIKTVGANIYDLFSDSFYMKNGFIGAFAQKRINSLIEYLERQSGEAVNPTGQRHARYEETSYPWSRESADAFINSIGEPSIQYALRELFLTAFYDEKEIDLQIERLRKLKRN